MLSTLSSNVVLSKARAMYGKRLTQENYNDLLNCRTVNEVAGYLKTRTVYGKALAGIEESDIHRGQLESKLRQKILMDSSSLCRYEITVGEHFSEYFIQRSEIEQILHAILLLDAGTPEEYLFSVPAYLLHHTHINLKLICRIKNYDDLLTALGHTEYHKILEKFIPDDGEKTRYSEIENALYSYLYSNVFSIIKKYTKGETARQLLDIFNSFIDLTNYARIIRLKTSYNADTEYIRGSMFNFGSIKKRFLNEMIESKTADEATEILSRTSIGKRALKTEYSYASEIARRVNFKACRHYISFSTHPSVVLISYMFISEAEINDIITIVEGIRYKLAPDEIKKMLTVANYNEGSG